VAKPQISSLDEEGSDTTFAQIWAKVETTKNGGIRVADRSKIANVRAWRSSALTFHKPQPDDNLG
jgi:hypothetical protein